MGSISKKKGARSKKIQENLQKLKAHGSMAQTHGSDGSGSNERSRSVGLIQIHQDLNQTAESEKRVGRVWVNPTQTRI